jgi:hypothetical protein
LDREYPTIRLILLSTGTICMMLLSACTDQVPIEEGTTTLPPPNLRVEEISGEPTEPPVEENPSSLDFDSTSQPVPENDVASSFFGTESHNLGFPASNQLIQDSGLNLIRHNALVWHEIEEIEGERNWDAAADLEEFLITASENGLEVILIVRGTPTWAQLVEGSFCGPIKPDKLAAFKDFMFAAVSRYSAPPFNVKFWELGNEPDVDTSAVRPNSVFGCWGDKTDPDYGGGYYTEMLKTVYPAIKEADSESQVLLGGLLLDCDPVYPPAGEQCGSGNFCSGVLRNGGGDYFDIVSFHAYPYYSGPSYGFPSLYYDVHHPKWENRGGVVLGKIQFIRQVMATYNVVKPLLHTEGSLLCHPQNTIDCEPPGEGFFEAQADYVPRLYVRNWANDVSGTIWYQFEGPGWRFGGLLDDEQNPKPAFQALKALTDKISGMKFSKPLTNYDRLEAYEFVSDEKTVWVLWSPDEVDVQIDLPENLSAVYDKYGQEITPDNNQITVKSPIFFELNP